MQKSYAPIITKIRTRITRRNLNWLCIICGPTGSGKSYTGLEVAYEICPKRFKADYVVFTANEFMTLLNSGKLRKGDVIIFDEAGVGIPAREWYSISNKMLGYVIQTFRNLNIGVIFTVPDSSFIDTQARKLFHMMIETNAIDYKNKTVVSTLVNLQTNPRYGDTYYKYTILNDEKGPYQVDRIAFHKPPQWLIDAYEEKKKRYTEALNTDIGNTLADLDKQKLIKRMTTDDMVKEIMNNKDKFVSIRADKPYIDVNLVEIAFEVGRFKAIRAKKAVESLLAKESSV